MSWQTIVLRNAQKLRTPINDESTREIAMRSRGTPRLANNRLRWVRDYATSRAGGRDHARGRAGRADDAGDRHPGLDSQDRKYLETIARVFHGGPVGVELSLTRSIARPTRWPTRVEPFLLRSELVIRTPRGRKLNPRGYEHLGLSPPKRTRAFSRSCFKKPSRIDSAVACSPVQAPAFKQSGSQKCDGDRITVQGDEIIEGRTNDHEYLLIDLRKAI